ncbi:MAG: hypothetical protein RJA07_1991 [Bacteroidota bacterium]|jgi:uncharacterized membrane protein
MNWIFSKPHFSKAEKETIRVAIEQAETNTSGEIRVYVENKCKPENVLDRAAECFYKLKMQNTELKNGVLIYIAIKDKKFAIIGDAGINKVVPLNFWDIEKQNMQSYFKSGKIIEGIAATVQQVGNQLQQFFPHQQDDKNELSDEMVIG